MYKYLDSVNKKKINKLGIETFTGVCYLFRTTFNFCPHTNWKFRFRINIISIVEVIVIFSTYEGYF